MTDDAHARANAEQVRVLREALAGVPLPDRPECPAAGWPARPAGEASDVSRPPVAETSTQP